MKLILAAFAFGFILSGLGSFLNDPLSQAMGNTLLIIGLWGPFQSSNAKGPLQ